MTKIELMMKFLLFILIGSALHAQNLVPNPSFELYSSCPLNAAEIINVSSWYTLPNHLGTPDYFNSCGSVWVNVPNNSFGSQSAHNGNAYIGIITYDMNYFNSREYIQTQLTSPMIAGQSYLVSFYVSCADDNRFASNNIGAVFTASVLSGNSSSSLAPLNIQSHISQPAIITNTTGWTLISGTYLATGNEQYLTIGNFYNDALTQATMINQFGSLNSAYYYIDQVSVTPIPLGNNEFSQQSIEIAPNPVVDKFTVLTNQNTKIITIELFSLNGKIKTFKREDSIHDIEDLPSGIYYIVISFDNNYKNTYKLVKL